MSASLKDLAGVFTGMLGQYYAAELKYFKLFVRLSEHSLTEELRSSLSAERNEFAQQIQRLRMLLKSLKADGGKVLSDADRALLDACKKSGAVKKPGSLIKDAEIVRVAKQIIYYRMATLTSLVAMASQLELGSAGGVLEQSCSECRNAAAYLNQIEQNIIYPAIALSGES